MNTPSHLVMIAALRKALPHFKMVKSAILWGSVAPDIPLYLLSLGGFLYFRFILDWTPKQTFRYIYDVLFFENPFWIIPHNLLHAPLILMMGIICIGWFNPPGSKKTAWWKWFLYACLFHSFLIY